MCSIAHGLEFSIFRSPLSSPWQFCAPKQDLHLPLCKSDPQHAGLDQCQDLSSCLWASSPPPPSSRHSGAVWPSSKNHKVKFSSNKQKKPTWPAVTLRRSTLQTPHSESLNMRPWDCWAMVSSEATWAGSWSRWCGIRGRRRLELTLDSGTQDTPRHPTSPLKNKHWQRYSGPCVSSAFAINVKRNCLNN